MFGGFDLSAIRDVVGEALKNASSDLESGVSSALGIDPSAKDSEASPALDSLRSAGAAASTQEGQEAPAEKPGAPAPSTAPPAPSGKKTTRKVLKKPSSSTSAAVAEIPHPEAVLASSLSGEAKSPAPKKKIVRVAKQAPSACSSEACSVDAVPDARDTGNQGGSVLEPPLPGNQEAGTAASLADCNAKAVSDSRNGEPSSSVPALPDRECHDAQQQPACRKVNGDFEHSGKSAADPSSNGDACADGHSLHAAPAGHGSRMDERSGKSPDIPVPVASSVATLELPAVTSLESSSGGGGGISTQPGLDPVEPSSLAGSSRLGPTPLEPSSLAALSRVALEALAVQLHETVSAGQDQMLKLGEQVSYLQQVVAHLQEKNEELALRSSRISEQDLEEMRNEFEQRLGAADRKVYALSKERDALKKGAEKLADYSALIKEKDGIIKQVMEEGERLASKQAELELSMKKLKQQVRTLEGERDRLQVKFEAEQAEAETQRRARAKSEREVAAAQEQARADLEAQKQQYEALLAKAKEEQAEAEEHARDAANAGLSRRLKEAEGRSEALTDSVVELREALERQRQAADLREEMLKQDIADLERRCQAAELRHQELTAKLPETARPLLRQIEAMQAAANAQADAWAAAEQMLHQRISDAETRAASAIERERLASERAQASATRLSVMDATVQASRDEVRSLQEQLDAAVQKCNLLDERSRVAAQQLELMQERLVLGGRQAEEAARAAADAIEIERHARAEAEADAAAVGREFERRAAELESQLAQAQAQARMAPRGSSGADAQQQPTMAAPGYRWVLVRDGEVPPTQTRATGSGEASRRTSLAGTLQQQHPHPAGDVASSPLSHAAAPTRINEAEAADLLTVQLGRTESGSTSGPLLAAGAEALRMELRMKQTEISALEARVKELTATRDQLAEELVACTQRSEKAVEALAAVAALRKELEQSQQRYVAAVELLGERDEALEELRADLQDVKNLYRDQIDYLVKQLAPEPEAPS